MYQYNLGIRFQAIAANTPEQIAIWFSENNSISYGQLNRLANRWARLLIESGAQERSVVCISGEKSLQTFACMLGCLKLGAVYTILDPNSPPERLRKILLTCKPKLMVADRNFPDKLPQLVRDFAVIDKDTALQSPASADDENLPATARLTGATPAYIMFTSGATGIPKGAVMTHANV